MKRTIPLLLLLLSATIPATLPAQVTSRCASNVHEHFKQIKALVPGLADPALENRHEAQMKLAGLAAKAGEPVPGASFEQTDFCQAAALVLEDPETPQPARVWIVRQLELVGRAESVPALAKLLGGDDVELRDVARRALEKNADPSASQALIDALKAGGNATARVGLVRALGQRAATEAIPLIAKQLDDPAVATAAAQALGDIGGEDALGALMDAADSAGDNIAPIAQAVLAAAGTHDEPEGVLKRLAENDKVPAATRVAAFVRRFQLDPDPERLKKAIQHENPKLSRAAIRLAGRSPVYVAALSKHLDQLPPAKQAQVLGLIADTGAKAAFKAVLPLARAEDPVLARAAVEALSAIDTPVSAAALLDIAAGDSPVGDAARAGLAKLEGDDVQAAIAKAAATGDPARRAAAIKTYLDRAAPDTEALMQGFAADADRGISDAALQVLEKVGTAASIPALNEIIARNPQGLRALKGVAKRASGDDIAKRIIDGIPADAGQKVKDEYLQILAVVGDDTALDHVTTALDGPQAKAAIRALSAWPDAAAVPALLGAAQDEATGEAEQVLAVRGLARLVESAKDAPVDQRAAWATDLYAAARRPDERKLVVPVLGGVAHPRSAETLLAALKTGEAKAETQLAAVTLAQSLLKGHKDLARQLAEAVAADKPGGETAKRLRDVQSKLK